ncbi:MAG: type II toxin-antitoxin system Phd/YefM family antitoxin [Candidatus Binataceae bacterium]
MKRAKIAELRNGLSRYLDYVRAGGNVIVCDRDTPIAEIVPLSHAPRGKRTAESGETRLERLERKGIIHRGTGDFGEWLKHHKPIRLPSGASLVDAILEERESGL